MPVISEVKYNPKRVGGRAENLSTPTEEEMTDCPNKKAS